MDTEPRIYVASLSDYNAGNLHGAWINCNQDSEDIMDEIELMLEDSKVKGAEEWAIHDYENFGEFNLSEYESIETVSELANLIVEHGEVFADFVSYQGRFTDKSESDFEESYVGEYDSELAFATECFDEMYPDQKYVDYKSYKRDLFCGDFFSLSAPNYKVYIFRSN